jgi:PKD repeat protein
MSKGGGKILICLFVLSGFFYGFVSVRLALQSSNVLATTSPTILINEIAWMGNVANENQEWIELKSDSLEPVDLTGWRLKAADGTPDIVLEGTIESEGYFLLERTSDLSVPNVTSSQIYAGALGNGGESLELYDASSSLVDLVTASSSWPAGDNATKQTMERSSDGGWHTSATPGGTPKALNSLPTALSSEVLPENGNASTTATTTASQAATPASNGTEPVKDAEIIITEILPSPEGSDAAGEFIELFNGGSETVDLTGWKLVSGGRQYVVVATTSRSNILAPRGYLAIWRAESKLVLSNDQGQVLLYSPEQVVPRQVIGYEKAPQGKSYARSDSSEWRWSAQPTPGGENIIKAANQAPEADWSAKSPIETGEAVLFDSSDTSDPEDDKLFFKWQFGDSGSSTEPSPRHVFEKPGKYKVELTVGDGALESSKSRTVTVIAPKPTSTPSQITSLTKATSAKIIINEFLPNPDGEDADGEWIELYNSGEQEVNLLNWQLDDTVGGSKSYQFSESISIKPRAYYLVNREDSNLALNNGSDEVRLFDLLGRLADDVSYSSAKEGLSYSRDVRGRWQWSVPTPGKANQIIQLASQTKMAANKSKVTATANKSKVTAKKTVQAKTTGWLTVSGTVTALPEQIAKQIFYIAGEDCWQIYNYRRDFPKLKLGDRVQVYGQAETAKGEKRLKTSKLADIKVLGAGRPAVPTELRCQQVGAAQLSRLVKISGELTKKTATLWYVDDDSAEIAVYLPKVIADSFSRIAEGERLAVVGLVTPTAAGVRLVPRGVADIIPVKAAKAEDFSEAPAAIPARNAAVELRQYLQLIGLGFVLAGLGWWLRKRYSV